MKTPHKHAALIKAWADGATIEVAIPKNQTSADYGIFDAWMETKAPEWNPRKQYRVKPEPTHDVVRYQFVTNVNTRACTGPDARSIANLMLVFDGETGALKDAQVLAHE